MWMEILAILVFLTGVLVIVGLPVMFIWAVVDWLRQRDVTPLFVLSSVACGFAVGLAAAWSYVVPDQGWHLSFIETVLACFDAGKYGAAIEDAAEDYVLFTLFFGEIAAILAGVAGWLLARHRRRIAVST